jgi:NAD(P)-dependent dehydrogenase (short-subunit alcohol dehydrogenase family)
MFDLTGRKALVAGSNRGIGRAIAEQLVLHGASVTVSGRNADESSAAAAEINAKAGREAAWGCAFDMGDLGQIHNLVDQSVAHWGGLDILVGNAFASALGSAEELDPADFLEVLRVNIVNTSALAVRALPALKASGSGAVVFVGSASGLAASPGVAAYGISKRGMLHMVQNLAVEWGQYNIRVNALVPGYTRTPTSAAMYQNDDKVAERTSGWPIARPGEVDEVAAGCIYLCSPGAGFTTGTTVICDGGRTLLSGNATLKIIRWTGTGTPAA